MWKPIADCERRAVRRRCWHAFRRNCKSRGGEQLRSCRDRPCNRRSGWCYRIHHSQHKATERQRRIAEERARLAYQNAPPPRKAQYRKSRYLAVDTVREKEASGAKSVMIYDTQTDQVVGNDVYDVKQSPKEGTISKFDTYSAEYVGRGT